jgi:hypothetical protein
MTVQAIIIILTVSLMITRTRAFTGLDCTTPEISATFSARDIQPCKIEYPNHMVHMGRRKLIVIQRDRLVTRKVRKCRLEYREHIFNCGGPHGDHAIKAGGFIKIKRISAEECEYAFERGVIGLMNGKKIGGLKAGTVRTKAVAIYGHASPTGTCWADTYFDYEGKQYSANMIWHVRASLIDTEEVFNIETGELVATGVACNPTDKACFSDGTTILPDITGTKNYCPYSRTRKADFDISRSDPLPAGVSATKKLSDLRYRLAISQNKRTMLRIITEGETTLCSHSAVDTNYEDFFLADASLEKYFKKMDAVDVRLNKQFDSKLAYATGAAADERRNIFLALQSDSCALKRKTIANRLEILRLLPPGKPGLVSNSPPVLGVVMGELIYLLKCQEVQVVLRSTETCYAEIPVTYRNKKICMDPRSKVIQPICRPIPCSSILRPAFADENNIWQTYGKKFERLKRNPKSYPINVTLTHINWYKLDTYNDGGLYDPKDVQSMLDMLHRSQKIETVTAILSDHSKLTNLNSLTLDSDITGIILEKYTSGFMRFIKTIQKVGNFVSSFFGLYVIFLAIKYIINRFMDLRTFKSILSVPLMCATLICPILARYHTQSAAHRADRRRRQETTTETMPESIELNDLGQN